MLFNLNEFLMSVSFTLDFVEVNMGKVNLNHSKRIAYIALNIARCIGMTDNQIHDMVAIAILHDNGISEDNIEYSSEDGYGDASYCEKLKNHCIIGENNIKDYPFFTDVTNVIRYNHERYDGNGPFGIKGEAIPVMAQIVHMANLIESRFDLRNCDYKTENEVIKFIKDEENLIFSQKLINAFETVGTHKGFWMGLRDNAISKVLKEKVPKYELELSYKEIHDISQVFSRIIDAKSKYTCMHSQGLANKTAKMANYYRKPSDETMKLIIAADLHDIGKLAVPNRILDSVNKLSREEFEIIKEHPFNTRLALQGIKGFEEITEWAANHHEKLNGKGYPLGKAANQLDFNSRLIACLDIYQALTEKRPYREGLTHEETMGIMKEMCLRKEIDSGITADIDIVFKTMNKEADTYYDT